MPPGMYSTIHLLEILFYPSPHPLIIKTISEWALKSLVSLLSLVHKITNVPVVYMGLDVWIWMGGNPFLGAFEGVGPEIETILSPEMGMSPSLWITPPSKSIRPAPYKQQVH